MQAPMETQVPQVTQATMAQVQLQVIQATQVLMAMQEQQETQAPQAMQATMDQVQPVVTQVDLVVVVMLDRPDHPETLQLLCYPLVHTQLRLVLVQHQDQLRSVGRSNNKYTAQ
jgi:hypothetical protein